MGRCRDSSTLRNVGTIVKMDDKLKLLVEGTRQVPCGCHPETCTHFGRSVNSPMKQYFEIVNEEYLAVDQNVKYEFFYKGDGVSRVKVL